MDKAGVIGLGAIGSGVALCLARSGQLAAVYDVRGDAADGLEGVPGLSLTPAAVAEAADIVIIAVVSAQQTIDVLSGPDGILAKARPGLTVILVATVAMEALKQIRALTDAASVALVDCGVTGGQQARNKGLVCLVGGKADDIERARPVIEGFAKDMAVMGGPGAGMAAKIARNVVVFGCLRAGYEAAVLCRNSGVDIGQLNEMIAASAEGVGGPMMLMVRDDPFASEQEAAVRENVRTLMIKDLDAAIDLADGFGVTLPLIELTKKTDRAVVGLADAMGEKH